MGKEIRRLSEFGKKVLEESFIAENKLRLNTQMDRKQYVELNIILELLGGKRNKKEKCHIFDTNNLKEAINEICDTMEIVDVKVLYQQFYTPKELAKRVVELADIKEFDDVMEPSAGEGAIIDVVLEKSFRDLYAYEIDQNNIDILKNKYNDERLHITKADFLNKDTRMLVDKIVANPPFTKSQDALHIIEMYKHLKEGGRLVAIASAGIKFRTGKIYDALNELRPEIIDIGEGSFKESGTMVNSVILIINK